MYRINCYPVNLILCITLPEGNVWKPCEIVCEKKTYFTHFSYDFHTFSHVFHIIFSHACEIILCERHVKDIWKSMWNRVILFTYFFTYNFTHFNARFIGRNFTYFSHASSHKSSYTIYSKDTWTVNTWHFLV